MRVSMTENGDDMDCIALVSYSANGEAICRDGVRSDKRARKKIRAFVPSKEDYVKVRMQCIICFLFSDIRCTIQVYNKIAEIIDSAEDYDGK